MPIFDTWHGEATNVPEDMKQQYPIGARINDGVVVGYEMKIMYNWDPMWFVLVMFRNGRIDPFERYWLQGNEIKEVIPFTSSEDLIKKAFK
jgi:hypothetical protein